MEVIDWLLKNVNQCYGEYPTFSSRAASTIRLVVTSRSLLLTTAVLCQRQRIVALMTAQIVVERSWNLRRMLWDTGFSIPP